jgi:hypothetical protein
MAGATTLTSFPARVFHPCPQLDGEFVKFAIWGILVFVGYWVWRALV